MREDQLSDAAHNFKHQMEQTNRRHEELLVAYKYADDALCRIRITRSIVICSTSLYMEQGPVLEEGTTETAVTKCC